MNQQQSLNAETVEGTVDQIRYQDPDSGWSVAILESGETIVGEMPGLRRGAEIKARGEWTTHDQYGRQLDVQTFTERKPTDTDGLQAWLERLDGFGPVSAQKLADDVTQHKKVTAQTIEQSSAVSAGKASRAAQKWRDDEERREALVALQGEGLTAKQADKAYSRWGARSVDIVRSNPYRTSKLDQIGFTIADGIARQMGVDHDADIRLRAGLSYTLKQARDDGHVGLPESTLLSEASDQLGVRDKRLQAPLNEEIDGGQLIQEHGLVYRVGDRDDEQTIADRLAAIDTQAGGPWKAGQARDWLDSNASTLTEEQASALTSALVDGGVMTLTGSAGTGKTYTLDAICRAWRETNRSIHLAAPTGRAAKRMEEVIGQAAETIHRLLDFHPQFGFRADDRSLDGLIVIDESSMLDTMLAARLLEAVSDKATVLFVGDPQQLPSVGPGYILQDVMDGPVGDGHHLTEIHRQAQGSGIVQVAYAVKQGRAPDLGREFDDMGLVEVASNTQAKRAVEATADRLGELGYDLSEDVQVLAPMYASEAGVDSLNEMLQTIAHDGKPAGRVFGDTRMAVGDRVRQTSNNYDLGTMNGDIGTIVDLAPEGRRLRQSASNERETVVAVEYPMIGEVAYTASEAARQLTLSYASTIHAAQGSEYPVAICVLTSSFHIMLERTLTYTAVTRAADFGVLIAQPKALRRACQNNTPVDRFRGLSQRLEEVV